MKRISLLVVLAAMVLVLVGCSSTEEEVEAIPTETPTPTVAAATAETGPIIVIRPHPNGAAGIAVEGEGNFGLLGINSDPAAKGVPLPEGYIIPARIHVYEMTTGKMRDYYLLVGEQDLPVERVIKMPLTMEIRVGPLKEGITQLLLE